MSFTDKVVLVTGGSSGIGAATAIAFANEGARVAIVGRNEARLAKVASSCSGKPLVLQLDISEDTQAVEAVKRTVDEFGRLDVLVNNAGILREASLLHGNILEAYDDVMNTNLRAVIHLSSLAAPHLIKTKGSIVNMSGVWGITTPKDPLSIVPAVSKAALNHFTKSAALELAPHGVRVNAISPGPVKTELLESSGFTWEQIASITALKHVSESKEVADLVLFLAGDKAKSITGSNYVIDNGMALL